jgi:hypothetical protein
MGVIMQRLICLGVAIRRTIDPAQGTRKIGGVTIDWIVNSLDENNWTFVIISH